MADNIDIRCVESVAATEVYLSARPQRASAPRQQAEEAFAGIRDSLTASGAAIFQERVFGSARVIDEVLEVRRKVYGDICDGVQPSYLTGKDEAPDGLFGVQVHGIAAGQLEVIRLDDTACGRVLRADKRGYMALSGIHDEQETSAIGQARRMMEKAERGLKQFGADFLSVPRTWMWLSDILSWYGPFNQVRNKFFTERGLIGEGSRQSMPASTGIGLALAGAGKCGMDLTAVLEPAESIEFLAAVGKQQCAFEYGSAFSRASRAVTPAGQTVFVSGTASIDASGATTHIGDIAGQINTTIDNVRAVLKDMGCTDGDVVQAVAYCKSREVEEVFGGIKGELDWPWISTICDICRDDLLFEIEATAMLRT